MGRRTTGAGSVALIALVAALALAGCQLRGAVTPIYTTPTVIVSPTIRVPAGWTLVTAPSQAPGIAPASLRTQYQAIAGQAATGAPFLILRRTDDFALHWTDLTPPAIADAAPPSTFVNAIGQESPLNPRVFILTLDTQGGSCAGQTAEAGAQCRYQYVTTDGGATWRPLTLPVPGVLGILSAIPSIRPPTQAQGGRLYSTVTDMSASGADGVVPPGRIVASVDGGATWRLADGDIAAHGLRVYGYAAAPSGLTIFAVTGTATTGPTGIWRSDNAGANWARVASLPGVAALDLMATVEHSTGKALLYLEADDQANHTHLYASRTGGAPWLANVDLTALNSATGAPSFLAPLPDGSALMGDMNTLKVWNTAMSAPRDVAPAFGPIGASGLTLQPLASEHYHVWLTGTTPAGAWFYAYTTFAV
ncbi:MAG: exo-alpha-sialidase [Chloroflexota bacterium]|nr:exo-alpha-sialidase [Chloroflexota bacterium]